MKSQLSKSIELFESQFIQRLDELNKSKADNLKVFNDKENELKQAEIT